jgi:methyl-accepting chemotaxis protein
MAKDSFIKKLASVFSGAAHDAPTDGQPAAAPETSQTPGQPDATNAAPEAPPAAPDVAVHPELADALRDLAVSINRLNDSSRTQANLAQSLRDSMAGLEEKREETTAAMREIAETLARQTDLLVDLQAKAGANADNAGQVASELHKLSDAIVSTNLANARNVEVLDQIRQRFDGANTQLAQGFQQQGRQISKLMLAIIALQAVFLLAAVVKWIILR